jgi:hypothetical protein
MKYDMCYAAAADYRWHEGAGACLSLPEHQYIPASTSWQLSEASDALLLSRGSTCMPQQQALCGNSPLQASEALPQTTEAC